MQIPHNYHLIRACTFKVFACSASIKNRIFTVELDDIDGFIDDTRNRDASMTVVFCCLQAVWMRAVGS